MELFSLRKIHRICPRHRGLGPPPLAHGSTDFIKRRSLVTGSTAQIKLIEPVSRLLISVVHRRSDGGGGWLRPGAAPAHVRGGALWPSMVAHQSSSFLELRWSVFDEVCSYGITTARGTVRWLSRCLSTVRAASSEASAPRTCAKASLSSLLASRPTNCSDRRRKTRI
jgi:hypothetical protein